MISAVDGMIYANQNMHVAASKQLDHQGRIDFQNIVAASLANDKTREIQETRAVEEDKALDPEREHNKDATDEQTGEKEEEERAVLAAGEKNRDKNKPDEDDDGLPHLLDIRA
ncbi:MAG TPA: hypothetical protein EYG69_03910 [Campylobacterales bacterium]|nr:hypothetical protein [Campylobacterales bacterium]